MQKILFLLLCLACSACANYHNTATKISENYVDYYTTIKNNSLRIAFIHLDDTAEKTVLDESQNILASVNTKN